MQNIIDRIQKLAKLSPHINLYKNFGKEIILKHMGKITGEIDNEYIEFLKISNGASILDYCFLGLKNNALGINLYENNRELWKIDCNLTFKFWGCIGDSTGNSFGYLDKKDESGNHYFGYYSINEQAKIYLVASSFSIFMDKFLTEIERTLKTNPKAIGLDNNDWFMERTRLLENDDEMVNFIKNKETTEYQ